MNPGLEWHISCVGPGWQPIVRKLIEDLKAIGWDGDIKQVKEKFGGLRFYTGSTNYEQDLLISRAEETAAKTCEVCGQPGELRGGGWLKTLCDTHDQEREAARAARMRS